MKHAVRCADCGMMYRDFAPEGSRYCECGEKQVQAAQDRAFDVVGDYERGFEAGRKSWKEIIDQHMLYTAELEAKVSTSPTGEPDAYQWRFCGGKWRPCGKDFYDYTQEKIREGNREFEARPLYTTPPAASVWVEEIARKLNETLIKIYRGLCYFTAEAKHAQLKDAEKLINETLSLLTRGPDQGEVGQTRIATKQSTDATCDSATETAVREAFEDMRTHRRPWRRALEGMRDQPPTDESDDRGYWEHELRAFDQTFEALKNEGVS